MKNLADQKNSPVEKMFGSLREVEEEYFPRSSRKKNEESHLFDADYLLSQTISQRTEQSSPTAK